MAQGKSDSFMNWLGRQIGHVKKAVKTDVTKKPATATPISPAKPEAETASAAPEAPKIIYRDESAEEIELPDRPGVKLRRTVIDEVIVNEPKPDGTDKDGV